MAPQPLLNIGIRAARKAGDLILRYLSRVDTLQITAKGQNDFVTEVDRLAERTIIETIRKSYPTHSILAEESGQDGDDDHLWVIDPLDGTTNFIHGFPVFSVSVALRHRGRLEQAVIYDPLRQELFTASRGAGAQLDGRRIRVSRETSFEHGLIGTGFPYHSNLQYVDEYMAMLREVIGRSSGVRRAGSAALDLAYVAAGRLDGFWEIGLKPWDIAAGVLLIREAGGLVSNFAGEDALDAGNIVAGNPKIYTALLKCLSPHVPVGLAAKQRRV